MDAQEVVCGGARLHVSVWDAGEPPILALHPGVADSRIWQGCAPHWVGAGHRVIAYDRRGFGATECVEEEHDDLVDLLGVTRATDSRPALVVGNSRGGGLALDLAFAHPDQVLGLVLIAPSVTGYDYTDWPISPNEAAQDELIAAAEAAGDLDLVNRLEVRYWLDGVDQPDGRISGPARELMLSMNGRALSAAPIGKPARNTEAWNRLGALDLPVLVIVGEHDLAGIRRQCGEIAAAIPAARLVTLAETAHCPSLDQPEQLATVVLDFLAEVLA